VLKHKDTKQEVKLIKEVQKGSKDSFKKLYDLYHQKIYALALRMTANENLAEDITQEIFIRVWNKIDTFKFKSSFYTWLYRLSVNVTIRSREKVNKQDKKEPDVDIETIYKDQKISHTDNIESMIDCERALLTLPDQSRKIFLLYVMEGYSHKDIQEATGIAVGTSKAHLSRARALLKKELNYEY